MQYGVFAFATETDLFLVGIVQYSGHNNVHVTFASSWFGLALCCYSAGAHKSEKSHHAKVKNKAYMYSSWTQENCATILLSSVKFSW